MGRLFKLLFWFLVFVILVVVADQVLLRTPPVHPAHAALREFYRDFRSRLLEVIVIVPPESPESIEAVIDHERNADGAPTTDGAAGPGSPSGPRAEGAGNRYIYVDRQGVLQFADSIGEIPKAYRESAQPLEK